MKWRCAVFESHLLKENNGVGLVYVYNGRPHRGLFFAIQNREENEAFPKGGFAIKFCPFCGKNLREWFESQVEHGDPSQASR